MIDLPLSRAFSVRVPATTANLCAGFDCLGLALELYNSILVEPAQALEIHISGEGAGSLPRARMMALAGMVFGVGFALVVIAQAIPELVLGACQ